jgi:hypothetical protein
VNASFEGSPQVLIHLYCGCVLLGILILQAGFGVFSLITIYWKGNVSNGIVHKLKIAHKVVLYNIRYWV